LTERTVRRRDRLRPSNFVHVDRADGLLTVTDTVRPVSLLVRITVAALIVSPCGSSTLP